MFVVVPHCEVNVQQGLEGVVFKGQREELEFLLGQGDFVAVVLLLNELAELGQVLVCQVLVFALLHLLFERLFAAKVEQRPTVRRSEAFKLRYIGLIVVKLHFT